MVGDRLDTDVKFGKDSGMKTALVLTGCTTAEKLMEVGVGTDEEPLPHIIFPHMGMMMSVDEWFMKQNKKKTWNTKRYKEA